MRTVLAVLTVSWMFCKDSWENYKLQIFLTFVMKQLCKFLKEIVILH